MHKADWKYLKQAGMDGKVRDHVLKLAAEGLVKPGELLDIHPRNLSSDFGIGSALLLPNGDVRVLFFIDGTRDPASPGLVLKRPLTQHSGEEVGGTIFFPIETEQQRIEPLRLAEA